MMLDREIIFGRASDFRLLKGDTIVEKIIYIYK